MKSSQDTKMMDLKAPASIITADWWNSFPNEYFLKFIYEMIFDFVI